MKIAWVTPLSQRSAIGRVSAQITAALADDGHDVLIIRSEHDRTHGGATHPSSLRMAWWHDLSIDEVSLQHDVVAVSVGDNYEFHAGALAFVDVAPCLGIFHDYYLYSLFHRYLSYNGLGEELHDREVRRIYGSELIPLGRKAWRQEADLSQIAQHLPMTEWIARRCGAALTHSQFYLPRIEQSCPGPIATAPLPFPGREVAPLRSRDGSCTITTIGVINPNKCAAAVIKSIGSSSLLKRACRYRLVGPITEAEQRRLSLLASEVSFHHLEVIGEVDDIRLASELENADILSCLRAPILEGASASAIEGMKSGRPLVVANAGFYAELPDDLVFKVSPSVDARELTTTLEQLVSDPKLRQITGARAKAWALGRFTIENYVSILTQLMTEFVEAKPLLALGKRVAEQLGGLGMGSDDKTIPALVGKLANLFGRG